MGLGSLVVTGTRRRRGSHCRSGCCRLCVKPLRAFMWGGRHPCPQACRRGRAERCMQSHAGREEAADRNHRLELRHITVAGGKLLSVHVRYQWRCEEQHQLIRHRLRCLTRYPSDIFAQPGKKRILAVRLGRDLSLTSTDSSLSHRYVDNPIDHCVFPPSGCSQKQRPPLTPARTQEAPLLPSATLFYPLPRCVVSRFSKPLGRLQHCSPQGSDELGKKNASVVQKVALRKWECSIRPGKVPTSPSAQLQLLMSVSPFLKKKTGP